MVLSHAITLSVLLSALSAAVPAFAQTPQACPETPFFQPAAVPGMPPGPPPTPAGFYRDGKLKEKLALTDEQVRQLREIDYDFLTKAMKMRTDMDLLHMEHEKLVSSKTVDETKAKAAIKSIAQFHGDLFLLNAEAKTAAAKVLKHEQRQFLENTFNPAAVPKGMN